MTTQAGDAATVREERRLGAVGRAGVVTVAAGESENADDHRAAAAQAWLAVARACLEADAGAEAFAAARSGIEELGQAYADPEADDDTTLKLVAAEDARDKGLEHAASAMMRVLEDRLAMFVRAQGGRVADVGEG